MSSIVNAAPMSYALGTEDKSSRVPVVEPESYPQHLPKVYIYAEKGPMEEVLVNSKTRETIFGSNTFDERSPYATHQTVLSNVLMAAANSHMVQRVFPKPEDGLGPRSNLALYLEVLEEQIPVYERTTAGEILRDEMNEPVLVTPAAFVSGFKVRWVIKRKTAHADESSFGALAELAGTLTNAAGTKQSRLYPIAQLWASSYGKVYNNSGIRLWAPTENGTSPMNKKVMEAVRAYPFRMAVIRRPNEKTTGTIVQTKFAEPYVEFSFREGVINPNTDANFSLSDTFIDRYQQIDDPRFSKIRGDFGGLKVYSNVIESLVDRFYAAERAAIEAAGSVAGTDLVGDSDEKWFFNFVSGQNASGAEYLSYQVDTSSADAVLMSDQTTHYAAGGADGTMSLTKFDALVGEQLRRYADPNDPVQENATNVESHFYDTGFGIDAKKDMCQVLAIRKDLLPVVVTHVVGGPDLTAAEERSLGLMLRNRLRNFPESEFYGTQTSRGILLPRSGRMVSSQYRHKLPLSIELARMSAEMMGASDGIWNEGKVFDRSPNNQIKMFTDINVLFTPASVRNQDWDNGMNWVSAFSRSVNYFPALQTVYDNDTSILNNYFSACLQTTLQKVGDDIQRSFTGSIRYTERQLEDVINAEVEKRTVGRFAGLYRIEPVCRVTSADSMRGYSWTLSINFYGNVAKTVQTLNLGAFRMSDYVAS